MKPEVETRADIARRRLEQLTQAFEGRALETDDDEPRGDRRLNAQHLRVVAAILVAAAVVTVWWLLSARPHESNQSVPLPTSTTSTSADQQTAPHDLVIDVEGKVKKPGIVTLPRGSRVVDAIKKAGGIAGKVNTESLNMARKINDGEQILVGIEPAAGSGPSESGAAAKLKLNTATLDQLDDLPGVGPVTAKAILDWRQKNGSFRKVEDLLDVKGIGKATLEDLRDLVVP